MHAPLFALVNLRKPKPRISRPHLLPSTGMYSAYGYNTVAPCNVAAHNMFRLTVNLPPWCNGYEIMPKQCSGNIWFHLERYKQFHISHIFHYYIIQGSLRTKREKKVSASTRNCPTKFLSASSVKSWIDCYYVVTLFVCVSREVQTYGVINCSPSP